MAYRTDGQTTAMCNASRRGRAEGRILNAPLLIKTEGIGMLGIVEFNVPLDTLSVISETVLRVTVS